MSKVNEKEISIEVATQDSWKYAEQWAAYERWDLGHGDADIFRAIDPNGFFIARISDVPVSAISLVNYDENYAHGGHYLTKPNCRGNGYGTTVWKAALEHAGERSIGLDGMTALEDAYSKWGFRTSHRTYRLSGLVQKKGVMPTKHVEQIRDTSLLDISDIDHQSSGIHRPNFIRNWLCTESRTSLSIVENGRTLAYSSIRPSTGGYRIGPVYSEESDFLPDLVAAMFAVVPQGSRATVDVPEFASDLIKECQKYGLEEQFSTLRMYRGDPLNIDQKTLKAIASLELG